MGLIAFYMQWLLPIVFALCGVVCFFTDKGVIKRVTGLLLGISFGARLFFERLDAVSLPLWLDITLVYVTLLCSVIYGVFCIKDIIAKRRLKRSETKKTDK